SSGEGIALNLLSISISWAAAEGVKPSIEVWAQIARPEQNRKHNSANTIIICVLSGMARRTLRSRGYEESRSAGCAENIRREPCDPSRPSESMVFALLV